MKKILSILMISVLSFSIMACANDEPDTNIDIETETPVEDDNVDIETDEDKNIDIETDEDTNIDIETDKDTDVDVQTDDEDADINIEKKD